MLETELPWAKAEPEGTERIRESEIGRGEEPRRIGKSRGRERASSLSRIRRRVAIDVSHATKASLDTPSHILPPSRGYSSSPPTLPIPGSSGIFHFLASFLFLSLALISFLSALARPRPRSAC